MVTCLLEQSLAGTRVVESLHRLAQAILREGEAQVAGGDLLDGVGLVKDDEVIREEVP